MVPLSATENCLFQILVFLWGPYRRFAGVVSAPKKIDAPKTEDVYVAPVVSVPSTVIESPAAPHVNARSLAASALNVKAAVLIVFVPSVRYILSFVLFQ